MTIYWRAVCVAYMTGTFYLLAFGDAAYGAIKISSNATSNMKCSGGICSPTAKKAVLNVTDLANMLASGDVTVKSSGIAPDIDLDAALTWTSTHGLTLDSYHSITFNQPLTVAGTAALTLSTNDGGSGGDFSFPGRGSVKFWDIHSSLIINRAHYILLDSLKAFVKEIRRGGGALNYAQIKNWNEANRTYSTPPIDIEFGGIFEGLGNSISHLTVINSSTGHAGLFAALDLSSIVRDLRLTSVNVTGAVAGQFVGALAGGGLGLVQNVDVSGQVTGSDNSLVGGLLGGGFGTVVGCASSAAVQAGSGSVAGGLIGHKGNDTGGNVKASYSTGNVSNSGAAVGGLIGEAVDGGTISESFTKGAVLGGGTAPAGGLVGTRAAGGGSVPQIQTSYSIGAVSSGSGAPVGGSIGQDLASGGISNDYWDLDTSGVSNPHQGAGNVPDDPGITGLTDAQLKSGLPAGFDPTVWAINPKINNGYPYLIANPPPK